MSRTPVCNHGSALLCAHHHLCDPSAPYYWIFWSTIKSKQFSAQVENLKLELLNISRTSATSCSTRNSHDRIYHEKNNFRKTECDTEQFVTRSQGPVPYSEARSHGVLKFCSNCTKFECMDGRTWTDT